MNFGSFAASARDLFVLALLASIASLAGCATPIPSAPESSAPVTQVAPPPDELIPVLRYGRYTLVELTADPPQQALMQQVIDITIPATLSATVGEALRYVLLRSGYQLCEDAPDLRRLDTLPLPAAHLHLGPLMLRDALTLLVGGTGHLQVDEATRQVCFVSTTPAGSDSATTKGLGLPESHS